MLSFGAVRPSIAGTKKMLTASKGAIHEQKKDMRPTMAGRVKREALNRNNLDLAKASLKMKMRRSYILGESRES